MAMTKSTEREGTRWNGEGVDIKTRLLAMNVTDRVWAWAWATAFSHDRENTARPKA